MAFARITERGKRAIPGTENLQLPKKKTMRSLWPPPGPSPSTSAGEATVHLPFAGPRIGRVVPVADLTTVRVVGVPPVIVVVEAQVGLEVDDDDGPWQVALEVDGAEVLVELEVDVIAARFADHDVVGVQDVGPQVDGGAVVELDDVDAAPAVGDEGPRHVRLPRRRRREGDEEEEEEEQEEHGVGGRRDWWEGTGVG